MWSWNSLILSPAVWHLAGSTYAHQRESASQLFIIDIITSQ
jgi:hypothetical protein